MSSTPHPTDQHSSLDSDAAARGVLATMGIIDPQDTPRFTPLGGGVSSDIWLVETDTARLVLKRPKHQLNVTSTWIVPLTRGQAEADWLTWVGEHFPTSVPHVLGFSPESFTIALSFFPPTTHTNWKTDLMAGSVDSGFAAELGKLLAGIHQTSFATPHLAEKFPHDDLFYSLRIEPFLERTATALPEVSQPLSTVIQSLTTTSLALVHGDFSPKNILVDRTLPHPRPIVLDAECAVWGDPAFDVAFCLTHLALKSIHVKGTTDALIDAATQFRSSYLDAVGDEIGQGVNTRLTALIPSLLLARVVGGSPAGYLTATQEKRVTDAATVSLLTGEACGPLLHPDKANMDLPW